MLAALLLASSLSASVRAQEIDVRALVEQAVRARMGADAVVTLSDVSVSLPAGAAVSAARPEPGARLGRPMRLALLADGREAGHVVVTCRIVVPHARAGAAMAAGSTVDAATVLAVTEDPGAVPLMPLPRAEAVAGSTAVRPIAAGETLTTSMLRVPFAVRSGERLQIKARIGAVVAQTTATAQQSGRPGDVVRVITDGRRPLRVRVTARGEGEVVDER